MDFVPVMKAPPVLMDARIFVDAPMGLRHDLLDVPLERRLAHDAQQDVFFVDFEGLSVRTPGTSPRFATPCAPRSLRSGARWMRWSTTTASRSCRNWWTTTSGW